jgi:hypothetical protein
MFRAQRLDGIDARFRKSILGSGKKGYRRKAIKKEACLARFVSVSPPEFLVILPDKNQTALA